MKRVLILSLAAALGAALAAAPPASATPPPPPRDGTDCNAKIYIIDDMVCASEALMRLDGAAQTASRTLMPDDRPAWPSLVETQTDWYWRRAKCIDAPNPEACVSAAYQTRIAELDALAHPPATGEFVECEGAPWGKQRMFVDKRRDSEALTFSNTDEVIMAVVWPAPERGWTPAVVLASVTPQAYELKPYNGPAIVCRRS